jgi:hypothetical protein
MRTRRSVLLNCLGEIVDIVLIIFGLTIQGSYAQNVETAAIGSNADTVKFLIEPNQTWRIKTFSIDQDVHVYSLGEANVSIEEKAIASTERSYGDIIAKKYIIRSKTGMEGLKVELKKHNLFQNLEISKSGFSFWVPENSQYRSKTQPN